MYNIMSSRPNKYQKAKSKFKSYARQFNIEKLRKWGGRAMGYRRANIKQLSTATNNNTQIVNKGAETVFMSKKSYIQNNIVGAGTSVSAVLQWNITQFPDIGNYSLVFNQYKCYKLKYTFRLLNIEFTDNAILPYILIRYNDDPDITGVTEGGIMNFRNVLKHTFTSSDLVCSYTVYPKKMMASQVYNSTTLTATPRKASWEDVDKVVGHYGLQYILPNLPTGMQIEVILEATVGFKEQW